jgi:hypothetical protein
MKIQLGWWTLEIIESTKQFTLKCNGNADSVEDAETAIRLLKAYIELYKVTK